MSKRIVLLTLICLLAVGFIFMPASAEPPSPQGPYLRVNVSNNWLELQNFPVNTEVNVQINSGGKLNRNIQTDDGGYAGIYNLWEEDVRLAFGDLIEANYDGGQPVIMTVDNIYAFFSADQDRVYGRATDPVDEDNRPVYWRAEIYPDDESWGDLLGWREGYSQSNGYIRC